MEKLKTLKTNTWSNIDCQAETIYKTISGYQEQGKTEVKFKGDIYKVNRIILETNGFRVSEHHFEYVSGEKYFIVSWQ